VLAFKNKKKQLNIGLEHQAFHVISTFLKQKYFKNLISPFVWELID